MLIWLTAESGDKMFQQHQQRADPYLKKDPSPADSVQSAAVSCGLLRHLQALGELVCIRYYKAGVCVTLDWAEMQNLTSSTTDYFFNNNIFLSYLLRLDLLSLFAVFVEAE